MVAIKLLHGATNDCMFWTLWNFMSYPEHAEFRPIDQQMFVTGEVTLFCFLLNGLKCFVCKQGDYNKCEGFQEGICT